MRGLARGFFVQQGKTPPQSWRIARVFNEVWAENTPPRHARGDFKQALSAEIPLCFCAKASLAGGRHGSRPARRGTGRRCSPRIFPRFCRDEQPSPDFCSQCTLFPHFPSVIFGVAIVKRRLALFSVADGMEREPFCLIRACHLCLC